MSSKTTNYNLHKIDLADSPPDITVLNLNFDTIDAELKKSNDHIANKENPHGVTAAQVGAIPTNQKGVANGVAGLGSDGKVPSDQLPEISAAKSDTATLTTSGWTLGSDDRYYQSISITSVTTNTKIIVVDVDLSTTDVDAKVAYLEAWGTVSANEVVQGASTLKFYAWEKPTVNIPIIVGVM